MKRYLLLDCGNSVAGRLALGTEELTQGKLRVIDRHERQARSLLEQVPLPDRETAACLVTVERGRVRAAVGRRLAWQLLWLLGPLQGRRLWNLVRQTGSRDQGEDTQVGCAGAPSNVGDSSQTSSDSCSKDYGG